MRALLLLGMVALLAAALVVRADDPAKADAAPPFRTDAGDPHLPWYQLKPGEFPPRGAEHVVFGELVEADFVRRAGQFRVEGGGEIVDFKLLPCATVLYLNTEADLRDVPIGTRLVFSLFQGPDGAFTRVAEARDDFSRLAGEGSAYRVVDVRPADGKIGVIKTNLSQPNGQPERTDLTFDGHTRIWKGDQPVTAADLKAGDELLANFTGGGGSSPARCADIWVGAATQKAATDRQRQRHTDFLKERGLPARITRVDGKRLTVALFGDPASLDALLKAEHVVPAKWAAEKRRVEAAVADEDLRTYNPPVDKQGSTVLEAAAVPTDRFGCAGIQWVIEPNLLLEGFRAGRVVRLFVRPSWKLKDMPFGEGLYNENVNIPTIRRAEVSPNQFPYRTDVSNAHLPWYRIEPGRFPPYDSHHLVYGELLSADPAGRSGTFCADVTGTVVRFTMPPFGSVRYVGAEANLEDVPPGTRCAFYLYQDEKGEFTRAAVVTDDFTRSADATLTYRVESVDAAAGHLVLASQLGMVKNDKDALFRPPDIGRGEFAVDDKTRVWDGERQVGVADLKPGDELLFNQTGRTATSRGRLTDVWVGSDTYKRVTDQQRTRQRAYLRANGLPAWVDAVDGRTIDITFFSGSRKDFPAVLDGDPWGKPVYLSPVDDKLRRLGGGTLDKVGLKNHFPEGDTAGTYGSSGVRWQLELPEPSDRYRKGQLIRVFKEGWTGDAILKGK